MRARQLLCGIWSLCFLFCLFCILLHQTTAKRKLKFVTIVFRHGHHTPQEFFPTEKHKETVREQGYGQLTKVRQLTWASYCKVGIQHQYELGQYLRRRYSYFLSAVYKQHEIYVRSTDCDHTLMSAQASLAGLYPPTQDQMWNPRIPWQPIPVHTVPLSHDNVTMHGDSYCSPAAAWQFVAKELLHLPFSHCPKYNELLRETFATRDFQRQLKKYRTFLKFLAAHTGYPLMKLNAERIWKLSDNLQYEDINNYTLPVWATPGVRTKLLKLSELLLQAEFGFHKQTQKSRLQGVLFDMDTLQAGSVSHKDKTHIRMDPFVVFFGALSYRSVLLKTILKHISDVRKPSQQQKLVMYSAHAATLVALQMALAVSDGKVPPYTACHFFELYQEKNGQYTIEMYYRNHSLPDPHPLTLPGCRFRCPLERFTQLVSPVLAHHWTRECRT